MKWFKSPTKRLFSILAAALLLLPGIALADSITPGSFTATLDVGQSTTITKTVTVSAGVTTPKVDVFFLADTTGSMGGAISGVISSASTILSNTASLGDLAFGVGEYKDTFDAYRYRLNQDMTTSQAAAQAGINLWSASGGGDAPEANMFALEQAANTTSWRAGSERILVWFGDAPGHDPDGGSTEASATAALVGAGIQVEAINIGTFTTWPGYNLDLCSSSTFCGATSSGGAATSGQATRITTATGGNLHAGTNDAAIVSTIQNAITSAIANYSNVGLDLSEVPMGVSVTALPPSYSGTWDRSITRTFDFDVTFTGDAPGDYTFSLYGTVDGGRIATEADHITVAGGAVPEPSTLLLLGSGLAGLGGMTLFRRKRS